MLTTTKTEAAQKHDLLVEGGEGDEKKIWKVGTGV